jgi:hypothetical protein
MGNNRYPEHTYTWPLTFDTGNLIWKKTSGGVKHDAASVKFSTYDTSNTINKLLVLVLHETVLSLLPITVCSDDYSYRSECQFTQN